MGLQSCKSPNFRILRISKFPIWESRSKMTFGRWLVARHKEYYKGEGGGFPQVWALVNLVSLCLPVARPCTKDVPTCCLVCVLNLKKNTSNQFQAIYHLSIELDRAWNQHFYFIDLDNNMINCRIIIFNIDINNKELKQF